jgi:outer membrane receptor for ferrienterochelin and colicins
MWIFSAATPAVPSFPRRVSAAAFILALAWAGAGSAQTACVDALRQAQRSYDLGLFEDVPGQLAPCLAARSSRATAIQVHSLLALAYLGSDDLEKAREEVSTILRLDSTFEPGPPPRFAALVAQVRREEQIVQVASVSKTRESLREAPATVVVVTGEEMERRGYRDLEEVLHDLPGFDISRSNGQTYSTFYQRGYRSNFSDRNLFLLDGVEQNDLSSNIVFLSRQYPLSNIDRIEVVYGPASTMYGANAYTGVINILTREPEAIIPAGRSLGVRGELTAGTFATRVADVTLAGRNRSSSLAWTLTARHFQSDERDLSSFDDWHYDFSAVDYKSQLRLSGPQAGLFCFQHPSLCQPGASPLFHVVGAGNGEFIIEPTPEGESLARRLDTEATVGRGLRFSDPSENWMIYGKLRVSNLTLGVELWRYKEGIGPDFSNYVLAPGSTWAPQQTALYLKYSQSVGAGLTFNALSRYLQNGLRTGESNYLFLNTYENTHLTLADLAQTSAVKPWINAFSYGGMSNQIRTELSLVYDAADRLAAVAGIEIRKGSLESQADLLSYDLDDPENPLRRNAEGLHREQIEHTDLAGYIQASYRPRRDLKIVLGGRLDYNELNNRRAPGRGFGALFTPRLAAIYTRGRSVLKAIYSEGFKDPTDFEKFGTQPFVRDEVSEELRPERVKNYELSGSWRTSEAFATEVAVYQANYRDVVALRIKPGCTFSPTSFCGQLANLKQLQVRGLQATAHMKTAAGFEAFANFTYTDPVETAPAHGLPIGDIARYRFNAGVAAEPSRRLTVDLRGSYVGSRRTGEGTTVATNPLHSISSSFDLKAALTYTLAARWQLQLAGNNLLDTAIFDPGVQEAGLGFAASLPQPGRTLYLRLITNLPSPKP